MQKLVEGRLKGASASLDVSWQALLSRSTTGKALLHEPPTDEEDAILARESSSMDATVVRRLTASLG